MKNIKNFHLKMNIFTAVKYCCILHGRVFVMLDLNVDNALLMSTHNIPYLWRNKQKYMSLVVRKPVFGVSDQVPHKPGCTATEDG